jgi:hypothetical protein
LFELTKILDFTFAQKIRKFRTFSKAIQFLKSGVQKFWKIKKASDDAF